MKSYIFFCIFIIAFCSCNKYLDVKPKGYTLLNTPNDYDLWLNSRQLSSTGSITGLNYLADNVDNPIIKNGSTNPIDLIYTWAPQFNLDLTTLPAIWSDHYSNIYYFNAVLNGVMNASGGTDQQKKELYAEALLGRAFEYIYLVNLYAIEYDSATADKDLAVPLVTSSDISQAVPPRSTVKEVYDQIINDLMKSIPDLPDDNSKNKLRGSKAAAYSVLARAYLYAKDYIDAEKNAQLALDNGVNLSMTNYNATDTLPGVVNSPEAIYGRAYPFRQSINAPFTYSFMTPGFMSLFDMTDLRLKVYYGTSNPLGGGTYPIAMGTNLQFRSTIVFVYNTMKYTTNYPLNSGTSVPEMKLTIAEGAARSGDLATALQQLNDLRKNRYSSSAYMPLQSANQSTVLDWVLQERQRELSFVGVRWFDMRRLATEGRMQTVTRLDGAGNIIATLAAGSTAYTLQIPDNVLRFNPGMVQNTR